MFWRTRGAIPDRVSDPLHSQSRNRAELAALHVVIDMQTQQVSMGEGIVVLRADRANRPSGAGLAQMGQHVVDRLAVQWCHASDQAGGCLGDSQPTIAIHDRQLTVMAEH
jgi:hypothetical protein